MPTEDVEEIEVRRSGYPETRMIANYRWVYARLAKRYAIPEPMVPSNDVPELVVDWCVALTTLDLYEFRGFNPESAQDALIAARATEVRGEVKEAADSETGLFELPLRASSQATTGVTKGGPFGYSEASPYEWTDRQREDVRR